MNKKSLRGAARTSALLVVSGLTMLPIGCSTVSGSSTNRSYVNAEGVGATDERFRRGGGSEGDNIFRAMDWNTPTDRRLGSGKPGAGYWQQRCDYAIDATLDEETDSVSASMVVSYHNNSPHELEYVWIQLEQNLFRIDSIGSRTRTPGTIMKMLEYDFDGGYGISRLESGGKALESEVYDTLMRVELDAPIGSGETFEFEMDFSFKVPPALRRMGMEDVEDGTIYELAQWFPHVCKYDDVRGWNTLPYLGSGEFYTDFGDYEVSITVPETYLVSASGALMNGSDVLSSEQLDRLEEARSSDEPVVIVGEDGIGAERGVESDEGMVTWSFEIENARTFAWAASDAFMWDACAATVTDRDGSERTVLCQSFYPREAEVWGPEGEGGGSTRYVKHSIEFYSDWLEPYPYPVMSNINGPEGGMEYPGIIFCGARTNPEGLFGVTDHEVGHTWFPMIVNSDERRYMWQDEGFNTFINIYSKADWYGEAPDISRHMSQTVEVCSAHEPQPIVTAPDRTWPRWVGRLMYRKTGYGLYLLREFILGEARFDRAFAQYIGWWKFKHPQPEDFFRSMEDAGGVDLAWFWRGWFLEPAALDLGIAGVKQSGSESAIIVVDSVGDMVMPVPLTIRYLDGSEESTVLPVEVFHTTSRWNAGWATKGRVIKSVVIDEDELLPDVDRSNNRWRR